MTNSSSKFQLIQSEKRISNEEDVYEVPQKSSAKVQVSNQVRSFINMEASNEALLQEVYKLRYLSYSSQQFIEDNDEGLFADQYDDQPHCHSFLTYHGSQPIGSIRACIFDPVVNRSIPILSALRDELEASIGLADKIVEANKFVVTPDFQGSNSVKPRFMLFDNVLRVAEKAQAKYVVAGVREEHLRFYKILGFDVASQLMSYPGLKFKTALIINSDLKFFRRQLNRKL